MKGKTTELVSNNVSHLFYEQKPIIAFHAIRDEYISAPSILRMSEYLKFPHWQILRILDGSSKKIHRGGWQFRYKDGRRYNWKGKEAMEKIIRGEVEKYHVCDRGEVAGGGRIIHKFAKRKEIAEFMGCNIEAVKHALSRGHYGVRYLIKRDHDTTTWDELEAKVFSRSGVNSPIRIMVERNGDIREFPSIHTAAAYMGVDSMRIRYALKVNKKVDEFTVRSLSK